MSVKQLEREMRAVGLVRVRTVETLPLPAYRDFREAQSGTQSQPEAAHWHHSRLHHYQLVSVRLIDLSEDGRLQQK